MLDPHFMHSVVLMCQHTPEGAYGLTLNRPADMTAGELMPDHPLMGSNDFPVHNGGPVGLDTLQFLHRSPEEIPGGVALVDDLHLGGDLESMIAFLCGDPQATVSIRLLVGYSGWGEGQLEAELETGSWIPAKLEADWIFQLEGEALWRRVLRSLGQEGQDLAGIPPDPSWN